MNEHRPHDASPGKSAGPAADTLVVIGDAGAVGTALEALRFLPPLRVERVPQPARPDLRGGPATLLLLLGGCAALPDTPAISGWLDRLAADDGPPTALLLPRTERGWCALASHPQCCGLLSTQPRVDAGDVERVVTAARRAHARRWRRGQAPTGRLAWSFTTSEAADVERAWLLLTSVLADLRGIEEELDRLGMAFAEALTNAVDHGNLELPSSLKDEDDGMARFFAERARRLADPRLAARRVRMELQVHPQYLRIRLRNQGPGFRPRDAAGMPCALPAREHPYGLGLRMIEGLVDDVEIAPDGRGITLTSMLSPLPRRRAA
jgi:anti-sigma regulatory factor (Ser/Thr protein kinase)